jgi:diguanylate cyclase (GGDEF)-like protein
VRKSVQREMSLFERDDLRLWQQSLARFQTMETDQLVEPAGAESHLLARFDGFAPKLSEVQPTLSSREPLAHAVVQEREDSKAWAVVSWQADPVKLSFVKLSGDAEDLLGYPAAEWIANPNFWHEQVVPEDRSEAAQKRREVLISGKKARIRYRMIRKNRTHVLVEELCALEATSSGAAMLGGHLIRSKYGSDQWQEEAENRIVRDIVRDIPGLIWSCDKRLNVTWSLGSDFSVLKVRRDHPNHANLLELFPERDVARVHVGMHLRAVNGESVSYEVESAGRTYQVTLKPVFDEFVQAQGCIGVALDISERKWTEEQVLHLATTDPLTELANYRRFREALELELHRANRSGRNFSLLLMDLDGLKRINDSYGHLTGSRALCRVAAALRACCRSMDTVARYGGDEFAVILPEVDSESAATVARRICTAIRGDTEQPEISASFGAATYPFDGQRDEELMAAADRRLYGQKHEIYKCAPSRSLATR